MPDGWSEGFSSEAITDDNRESFNTFASKYESMEAAVVGGFNAQKAVGAPYKFPESMDKLPDDAMRAEFTSKANKLLGIEHAGSVDDFADLNLKMGMAEGSEPDENFSNAFKQFCVDKKIPKSYAQELVNFHNESQAAAMVADAEKQETDREATAKSVNEELNKQFGSPEEVLKQSELFKRAIRNNVGLSNDEAEEFADAMIDAGLTRNAVMAGVMLKVFAPLAAEGQTDGGGGVNGGQPATITPYEFKKSLHPGSESLWGKPNDSWSNESISMRKRAGIEN